MSCSFAHGIAACQAGQCVLLDCQSGYADCDGLAANGCERSLADAHSCGACGRACAAALPRASALCNAGRCQLQCQPGYGDCNARAEDGCGLQLTAAGTCGACASLGCVGPRVSRVDCHSGACEIMACTPGFEDCNGAVQDGCEADLLSAANCGSCSARCTLPHVLATRCEQGAARAHAQCLIDRSCARDELDFPCIPGTARPNNSASCGGCGQACLLFCCGSLF